MKIWKSVVCLMAVLCMSSALAKDESNPFAALTWTFGAETLKPDVVIGYRSVDVETDGDVDGWQGSVSYRPQAGVDKIKLEAVTGDENMQATYGAGYSLQKKQALLTAGATGSYLTAGADFLISSHKIEPYVGLTTLHEYDVPEKVETSNTDNATTYTTESTAVNDVLQETYFPEYEDCYCQ